MLVLSSLWIWKGVSATLQSGRYTLSYLKRRYIPRHVTDTVGVRTTLSVVRSGHSPSHPSYPTLPDSWRRLKPSKQWNNGVSMLGQLYRRWANIKTSLFLRVVFRWVHSLSNDTSSFPCIFPWLHHFLRRYVLLQNSSTEVVSDTDVNSRAESDVYRLETTSKVALHTVRVIYL